VKLVQVLHHSEEKDSSLWMLGVGDQVVHNEGVYNSEEGLLNVPKRIEMASNRDRVLGGEDRVGRIRFHESAIKVWLEVLSRCRYGTHSRVPG